MSYFHDYWFFLFWPKKIYNISIIRSFQEVYSKLVIPVTTIIHITQILNTLTIGPQTMTKSKN